MNQKSDDLRLHVAQTLLENVSQPENVSNLDSIFSFLRSLQADSNTALKLSQSFETLEFQIGDELINYLQNHPSTEYYYIICQGRVRLLSFDPQRQREVSIQVLQAEETFGAEHLYSHPPRLTRTIAASALQVARISLTHLQQWYDRIPKLEAHLRQQAQQRNCLTFFKTMTELRSLASLQLQQLVPYVQEKHIASGTVLLKATPAGRLWLSSGTVQSQSDQSPPPTEGQSWEDSDPVADWVAATDLVAYQLAKEHWANAQAIAPVLFGGQANGTRQKFTRNGHHRSTDAKIPLSQPSQIQQVQQAQHSNAQSARPRLVAKKTAAIAFPKPQDLWRRSLRRWQHPFIQQQSTADCGATCLAMVGRYWGKSFGLNYLRDLAGVGRTGASLKGLAKAAESLGFHARPVRASLSRLVDRTNPWIAHWQGDHYVVVYRKAKGDRLLVADPAVGKRSLSYEEFQASWTGYALLLDPTERLQDAEGSNGISLKHFWSAFLPYRSILGQIIIASLLLQVFGLVTPLFTQLVLDRVVVEKSFSTLNVFVVGLLLFGVWRIGLVAVRQYLLDYFSNRMDLTFISGFISHTLRLPLKFFELRQVGDILTRVQENQKIQLFLTRQAIGAWLDALSAVVYVGLMFYYNSSLTLLVLSLIVPIIILTVATSPFLRQVSRQIFKESAAQNSTLVEMMSGVATIKATAAEKELRWLWEERFTSMLNARFRGQKLANGLQILSSLVNSIGSTALLWYGAVLVMQD